MKPLYAPVPVTAPSWTSIHTGLSVEEHGVDEMWKPAGNTDNVFFWEQLNREGYTCEVMNAPATYPPRPVDRYLVCGFPMPLTHKPFTHPPELMNRLPEGFRQHMDLVFWDPELKTNWFLEIKKMDTKKVLRRVEEGVEVVVDKLLELHRDSDLVYLQLSFIDRVCSHVYHRYYKRMYRLVQNTIRRVERGIKPRKTMIVSDHGDGWFLGDHSRFGTLATKKLTVPKKFPENREVFHYILEQI